MRSFRIDGEEYVVASVRDQERLGRGYRRLRPTEAIALMRQWQYADELGLLSRLRDELRSSSSATLSSSRRIDLIADMIVDELAQGTMGSIALYRRLTPRPAVVTDVPEEAVPLADLTDEPIEEDPWHFIEIELIDEDDAPVPGITVQVSLPDGRGRTGLTDDFGLLRIESIVKEGDCRIRFPGLRPDAVEHVR
ncbi:MAG: hypothetical protein KDK70_05385 [Myxococcales bacterium]|nr:hypothetical protein [Myxococcales bacterium]